MATQASTDGSGAAATPGKPTNTVVESSGVDALIGRLRDSGIAEGRTQAEALVAAARQQAAELLAAARQESDALLAQAHAEREKLKAAGEDAIRLATRDTILALESDLIHHFQEMLRRLVKGALVDPTFLQKVILEVAGAAGRAAAGRPAEVLLPAELVSLDDLRKKPEQAKPGTLMHFVLSAGAGLLREGVTFGVGEDVDAGIRVKLAGEDMQVELTDAAVSAMLLRYMLPRFRALLRGAVAPEGAAANQADRKAATA